MAEACANPLLLGWIKEWLDQARELNSKGVTVYKRAYDSMKVCPLTFNHPIEALRLNGIGPKLCDRLTEKLKAYCEENGLPMPETSCKSKKRPSGENLPDAAPPKKPRKSKQYVPALRSGAYALLLGLATQREDSSIGLSKAQLIELAQPHCDASFTTPVDTTKFYTAWSSMKTLIQKDLVYEHGRPLRRYTLTEEGCTVAKTIQNTATSSSRTANKPVTTVTSGFPNTKPSASTIHSEASFPLDPLDLEDNAQFKSHRPLATKSSLGRDETSLDSFLAKNKISHPNAASICKATGQQEQRPMPFEQRDRDRETPPGDFASKLIALPPGSFKVQLILDSREIRASTDRDYIANELIKKGITPQVRALEVGDALWVARFNNSNFLATYQEEGEEVLLDWIVERKRLDDLIGSIKDGRFLEQKFRLQRSGIKNVIYLVEDFSVTYDSNATALKFNEIITSAIASTQVVSGYFVKKTRNIDDTIRYLARMTFLLQKMYEPSGKAPTSPVTLIPSSQVFSQSYLTKLKASRDEDPSTTYAVTYPTFAALTSKSDVLTLRDIFLKMLMRTRGISGEKALEIQRRWNTPRKFIEAFEAFDGQDPKEKEKMVSDQMKSLVGRKKVAHALSKKLAEIWGEAG
ncbi:hypothetical protein V8E54_002217 [Elaphomyces granulatus]